MPRLAVFSDVHGNVSALEAVRKAVKAAKPEATMIAGDLVLNGPEPAAALDAIREMEQAGAIVIQGNTDVAVADFDYAAAFPWMTEGVPDSIQAARSARPREIRGSPEMMIQSPSSPKTLIQSGSGVAESNRSRR